MQTDSWVYSNSICSTAPFTIFLNSSIFKTCTSYAMIFLFIKKEPTDKTMPDAEIKICIGF